MRTITHRELRNNSGAVLREVAAGETIAITNHGEVVAQLGPPQAMPGLRIVKPARGPIDLATVVPVQSELTVAEVLDDLRGDR